MSGSDSSSNRTAIVIAIIGVIGTLGAAAISNIDKFFPPHDEVVEAQNDSVLHEGVFELRTVDGAPQKTSQFLRLSKVSDERYRAEAKNPNGLMFTGEFNLRDKEWEFSVENSAEGAYVPPAGGPVSREGVLLTIGPSEWEETH